jgi:hypothetical protein
VSVTAALRGLVEQRSYTNEKLLNGRVDFML